MGDCLIAVPGFTFGGHELVALPSVIDVTRVQHMSKLQHRSEAHCNVKPQIKYTSWPSHAKKLKKRCARGASGMSLHGQMDLMPITRLINIVE